MTAVVSAPCALAMAISTVVILALAAWTEIRWPS